MPNRKAGSSVVIAVILLQYAQVICAQNRPLFSSLRTQQWVRAVEQLHDTTATNRQLRGLRESLETIEENYNKQVYAELLKEYSREEPDGTVKSIVKGVVEDIPFIGGAVEKLETRTKELDAQIIAPIAADKLMGQNSAMNAFYVNLRQSCNNDVACIEQGADAIAHDPGIQSLLAGHPEIANVAKLKELIVAHTKMAEANQGEVIEHFTSMNALTTAFASLTTTQLTLLTGMQATLINNTAEIINTQQKHTIALSRIQATINANQAELKKRLDEGFGTVIGLQMTNIFLTDMVLEHTDAISGKLDQALVQLGRIDSSVNTIRARQLDQIYTESPLSKKLKILEGQQGKELITDSVQRQQLIENVKVMIEQERIVAVTKKVREWGLVSLEALNVFYPGCPDAIKKTVSVAITASDIVGGITTGNYSQAIMAGLSLFKKPSPGPEMQMLMKITQQLTNLESNMNAQFRAVHEQLFAMEQNLATRMEIVDQKLDMIAGQIARMHAELSEGLLSVDSKVSYVIRQNECTQDLILEIFRAGNSDVCQGPVREFKKRVSEGNIKSLQDLEQFFIGQQCKSCVEALFNNASQNLLNSPLFRYSNCNPESATTSSRPDNLYTYIFTYLLPDSVKNLPSGIFCLLNPFGEVNHLAAAAGFISRLPDWVQKAIRHTYETFTLSDNDKQYRHYAGVLELADYVLTMMPFLELYNDGNLMTAQQLSTQPEITRERSRKIIGFLDNLSQLIDHTLLQQSIISGLGSFAAIDQLLAHGDVSAASGMKLSDVFVYDPLLAKNYTAYYIDKHFGGLAKLSGLRSRNPYNRITKYYEGNNAVESLVSGDAQQNWTLETNWGSALGKKAIFKTYLPPVQVASDTAIYSANLSSAFPESLDALLSAKRQINQLSAEMRFVISDELDKPGALLSRSELDAIIRMTKN